MTNSTHNLKVNRVVTITYSRDWGDYRVPAPDGREVSAYYTDDLEDAVGTACSQWMWGPSAVCRVRKVDEHPTV